jgi:ubiquinone/menaquinone biosynthesis C-methylase UbiE
MKSVPEFSAVRGGGVAIVDNEQSVGELYSQVRVAREYIEKRNRFSWQKVLHARQVSAINHAIALFRPTRVLEVAPGPARLAVDLEGVKNGIMVENSREMILIAESRLRSHGLARVWRLVQGNAFELDKVMGNQEVEFAFTFRFIRHFNKEDRRRLYRLIRGRLSSGGVLMFDVVSERMRRRLDISDDGRQSDEPVVYDEVFTERGIRVEMAENGFEVVSLEPVLRNFRLQSLISHKMDDLIPRVSLTAVRILERVPTTTPLEWVAVCRKV